MRSCLSSLDAGLESNRETGLDSSLDVGLESNRETGLESSLDAGLDALDSGLEGTEVNGRCLAAWRSCISRSFRAERLRLLGSLLSGSPLVVHLLWGRFG